MWTSRHASIFRASSTRPHHTNASSPLCIRRFSDFASHKSCWAAPLGSNQSSTTFQPPLGDPALRICWPGERKQLLPTKITLSSRVAASISLGMASSSPTRIGSGRAVEDSRQPNMVIINSCDKIFFRHIGVMCFLEKLQHILPSRRDSYALDRTLGGGGLDRYPLLRVSSLAAWSAASFAAY